MAYQSNKPLPTDRLKDSQADIQNNFASLETAFNLNHVALNASGEGKHKFLQMPEQSSAPASAVNEMSLYTKEEGSVSQLFVRRESSGTEINLTNDVSKNADGWTRLPNGLIMKWGVVTATRNTLNTVTYTVSGSIPVFTTVYNIQVSQTFNAGPTTSNLNTAISAGNYTATTFQVFPRAIGTPSGSTVEVRYVSIGV